MTLQYRAWALLRRQRCTPTDLAACLGIHYQHARYVIRRLCQFGHAALHDRRGRERVYRATDLPCPVGGHYDHTRRPRKP